MTWSLKALLPCCVVVVACSAKPKEPPPPSPAPEPTPQPVKPAPAPAPQPIAPPAAHELAPLVKSSNTFGWELWKQLPASGNQAMSPASITTALAMTWGGAKANTAAEMKQTLHLDGDAGSVAAAWGKLAAALQAPKQPELRIANRLYGERTYKLDQGFVDRTRAAFGAPLDPLDFVGNPAAARTVINTWVAQQTNQRIKDLLPPPSITNLTKLVLVNALYFLADWQTAFEHASTVDADFASVGATLKVPTMHAVDGYRLAKADGVAMLELPYKGDAAMYIILPDKLDGLPAVEKSLDAGKLATWIGALANQRVAVALPRFTIDPREPTELSARLKALGMKDAFDSKRADFTGIASPPNPADQLVISAVFHKAFVKVDEKGTEAAAATAVVMAPKGAAPAAPIEFKANHPFLFVIADTRTGLVLFIGRVSDPS
jgi:serpin B